jgi:molecular chaperone GrpE
MSDHATTIVPENAPGAGPQTVTGGEIDSILADFRRWLMSAPRAAAPADRGPAETIDLSTVLNHYVALRQEVNLQTRAVRAQQEQTARVQEQNGELLEQLQQALEALTRSQARNEQLAQQGQEERLRPLLKTLVDLYDALSLAGREIQKTQESMAPLLEPLEMLEEPLPELPAAPPPRSFWSRWLLSPSAEAALRTSREETHRTLERLHRERSEKQVYLKRAQESCRRAHESVGSLVAGYTMSLQRIERALRQHGLEAIPTVGESFDPERMEVVDTATNSGEPAGTVVAEVRRGYLWNGRVFRFAQVCVAKA